MQRAELNVKRNWTEGGEEDLLRLMREPLFLIFEETPGYGRRRGRILLVADEVSYMRPWVALSGEAHLLLWTGDKEAVLDAVRKRDFDLVLLMCLRLGHNAPGLVRDLKAFYPQILVMVVASEAPGEVVAEVFRAGARDCLIGDVERGTLRERLARLLEITSVGKETRENLLLRSGLAMPGGSLEAQEAFVDSDEVYHSKILRARVLIHREYGRKLSLDEMAEAAYMSRRHFSRMFRKVMRACPLEYVNRVRIGEAKRRLRQGGCSIAEVGQEVGFESAAYFHRVFKELEGMSPGAYREKVMRKGKMAG